MEKTFKHNRLIYFDEKQHKYTDDLGNPYTSVTTVLKKYESGFDKLAIAKACARIGRNPNHPRYAQYRNKSVQEILDTWDTTRDVALENGSLKHNFLEDSIKKATGYNLRAGTTFINGRIYTIYDVIDNPGFGELSLEWFVTTGIAKRYPIIYEDLCKFAKHGYRIYAEVGVYDPELLISGLIDLFITDGIRFVIFDWKTNKSDIRFENGYYEKDVNYNLTTNFVQGNKMMKYPIDYLADSVGNHYSLQVSGYAWFAIQTGLVYLGSIIYQIREDSLLLDEDGKPKEYVTKIPIPNLVEDAYGMFYHFSKGVERNNQSFLRFC